MKRKFKKIKSKWPLQPGNWQRKLSWLIFFSLLLVACAFTFHHKVHSVDLTKFHASYARFNVWLSERRALFHHEVTEVKTAKMMKAQRVEDVHFEFYTALPAMQMKLPTTLSMNTAQTIPALPTTNTPISTAQNTTRTLLQKSFVSAAELEKDFAIKLQPVNTYILQLGMFREMKSAEGLRASLLASGLTPTIHRLGRGEKALFRVQLGPYASLSQAKNTAHQLQRKGFSVLLRTTNKD